MLPAMAIQHPITNAEVAALDFALEPERKLQSLLALWLGNYFTGQPFTTRKLGGGTETKTFAKATLQFQEAEQPKNPQEPILHVLFDKIESTRQSRTEASHGHEDQWILTVMTKVPASLTGTGQTDSNAEYLVRRVADQALWLFSSGEREALSVHGVCNLEVERPPAVFSGGAWLMRMMTVSCVTFREQAR